MRVIIWKRINAHRHWTAAFRALLAKRGHDAKLCVDRRPPACDVLVIWNGNHRREKRLAEQAKQAGVRVFFMEVGYLSQRSHYIISKKGSVGGDLLRGEAVPKLTPADDTYLQNFFAQYAPGVSMDAAPEQVSGFLQLNDDFAIKNHTRFANMQEVVDAAEALLPSEKIVWKVHPKQRIVNLKTRFPVYRGGSIWPHIARAKLCVAANSTALFEAALAGREVKALGDSPLNREEGARAIVREVLRRQIPVDGVGAEEPLLRSIGEVL